ncbi:Hint domain-containing protein [Paracoccus zeaxanthinifaciens]|uniref:Hint domain-containing protein n=1 Tax=Paracoccus zeaxanthinifaciens TaxID=187400 RepID=UPI0003B74BB7|nr:Hint domain-containing protein [Paracoccus zeaxanthinifaciens]
MPLEPGDLLFVGFDADNEDIAFLTTVDIPEGEVIYFTDDEWNGTNFIGNEQLIEWTVPAGGISANTVVTLDMARNTDPVISTGGSLEQLQRGDDLENQNEMFWAFQGTRDGDTVTPTNFIAVIGIEADGPTPQTPNLEGTGLTPENGALVIDGDNDYMEWTADADLTAPFTRQDLLDSILAGGSNWTVADSNQLDNPNGVGFDINLPTNVICFAGGTLILTPDGEVDIQTLRPGDMVLTEDSGPRPLSWVGSRRITRPEMEANPRLRPVRILAGALGGGLPRRDLLVSRQHRLLLSSAIAERMFGEREVLLPAIRLTALPGIFVDAEVTQVTYLHLMFDRHEIVLAEGAPAESLHTGPQAMDSITDEGREEIFTIFPELRRGDARPMARHVPDAARQKRLVARHLKNERPVLS